MSLLCPLCNTVKDNVIEEDDFSWARCAVCLMCYIPNLEYYRRRVGPYWVYWNYRFPYPYSSIWTTNGDDVYNGDPLPIDISEDGLKIVLTFQ